MITNGRPVADIWLPDGFVEKIKEAVAVEGNAIERGALQRCLDAMCAQTSRRCPLSVLEETRILGDDLFLQPVCQFEVILQDGIEPARLGWILARLAAEFHLVDDTAWQENGGVGLAAAPLRGLRQLRPHAGALLVFWGPRWFSNRGGFRTADIARARHLPTAKARPEQELRARHSHK